MVSVHLSKELVDRVEEEARQRNKTANRKNLVDRKKSTDNAFQVNKYGLLGELAFSLVTGIDFASRVDEIDFYDFVLPDGRTVDVKHTPHDNGTLVLGPKAERDIRRLADLYILTTGQEHIIDVIGYRGGRTLYNNYRYHPGIGCFKRYLKQSELIPVEDLLRII